MIEREYVKFNTSIQTGSNKDHPNYDGEGNIEASIELRLPDNIFTNPRKIARIDMLASKLRLSLENTPIAQMQIDTSEETRDFKPTKCMMDVYPYCLLDDGHFQPRDENNLSFPFYHQHDFTVRIFLNYYPAEEETPPVSSGLTHELHFKVTPTITLDPSDKFYSLLEKGGVFKMCRHLFNMSVQSNHEPFKIENGIIQIQHISTLEQIFQDALQNAITFASTKYNICLDLTLVGGTIPDTVPYDIENSINITTPNQQQVTFYFSTCLKNDILTVQEQQISSAIKPIVKFDAQSLSISYDTGCFKNIIPIFWNPTYIHTYDIPEQLTINALMREYWQQPPLKRVYKQTIEATGEPPREYSLRLDEPQTCRVMNLIVNEEMAKQFSFLPWIKVNTSQLQQTSVTTYHVNVTRAPITYTTYNLTSAYPTESGGSIIQKSI